MHKLVPIRVQLGTLELDLRTAELRDGKSATRLSEQLFRLLLLLVEHPAELVTREDIRRKLWPNNTIVEFDQGIQTAISKLRRALGDSADSPKYIETVGRRGYRLIAPVQNLESSSGDEIGAGFKGAAGRRLYEARDLIGKQVSHYRVLEVVRGGGMGMVYKAEDLRLGRCVALKFLPEEMSGDPVALQRFEREARTASSINHPNICTVYEVEEHEGQPFIVMELLEGRTLQALLATDELRGHGHAARAAIMRTLSIAMQVLDGLEAAHEKGIVHRDMKPGNLFLTSRGVVKMLDFGLAKLSEPDSAQPDRQLETGPDGGAALAPARDLTVSGMAAGTAGYMSPEQIRREKLDARTDIFSFGLVLYEMLTGERPFTGETVELVKESILVRTPAPVRQLNPAVPAGLERIVNKATEKGREQRYQSAAEMRAALQAVPAFRSIVARRWASMVAAIAALLIVTSAFVLWRRSHRAIAPLSANDTLVLAGFLNTTSDSIFDGTLRQALDLYLQQSPSVNVLSERKISEALKSLHHSSGEALTPELARQTCVATQSRAILTGSIANHGNRYVIRLAAQDCPTGRDLTVVSAEAQDRDKVIHVLGEAGSRLRSTLGDSTVGRPEFNRPLEEDTTASLDAMQEYSRAVGPGASDDPTVHLQRAVELDPNFALAYQQLGRHYMANWQSERAAEAFTKAYALRSRLSLRHRLGIEASYYLGASGELDKAVPTFSELLRNFPESGARNQLCFTLRRTGHLEQAAAACLEAMRFNRGEAFPVANTVYIYVALDRLADAQAVLDEAQAASPGADSYADVGYTLAFAQGNQAAMRKYFSAATAEPGVDAATLFYIEAYTQTYYGRVAAARQLWQRATTSVNPSELPETVAGLLAREALMEAEVGNKSRAESLANEALALSAGRDVRSAVALALARSGDPARAQELADQVARDFPRDTLIQCYQLPLIRASLAIANRQPRLALEALQAAAPCEASETALLPTGLPSYVRAEAYLQAGLGGEAAAESQKVLAHPGLLGNSVHGALARLQLARAQAKMGDHSAARHNYRDFLDLWKDADPDVPVYMQATVEYEKLQ
jgi:serine/threonine protein kinase/DNA-binding winged helix-turn-helix (wHTH) protein/tetratricopeptide (TPR) repeat protein